MLDTYQVDLTLSSRILFTLVYAVDLVIGFLEESVKVKLSTNFTQRFRCTKPLLLANN